MAQSSEFALRNGLEELDAMPPDVPPISEDRIVDGTKFMHWLETGEGDPWAAPDRE